jgi:hypothetical protein
MQVALSWDGGTSVTSVKTVSLSGGSDTVFTFGGPSDTWGRTWSESDFASSNFRVRIISQSSGSDISIDAIQVKVYHSSGGGSSGGGSDI